MNTVILASHSPRRYDLLAQTGLHVIVKPSHIDEIQNPGESIHDFVTRISKEKVLAVKNTLDPNESKNYPMIGADTLVYLNDTIYSKPTDIDDAKRILSELNGQIHTVITGYAIYNPHEKNMISGFSETNVKFKKMTEDEINWYLSTGESMGKSGAFALQGHGAFMIEWVHGSYTNVVGLPLDKVITILLDKKMIHLY